jgi:hypothetical protein
VINFLGNDWQPKYVTIGLFETKEIIRQALVQSLKKLFNIYNLKEKIISYVKDEGSNLNAMINALKSIVSCEFLSLEESLW